MLFHFTLIVRDGLSEKAVSHGSIWRLRTLQAQRSWRGGMLGVFTKQQRGCSVWNRVSEEENRRQSDREYG